MKRLNIMFSSDENHNKWLYDRSNWEQTLKDLNMTETINFSTDTMPQLIVVRGCAKISVTSPGK